MKMKSLVTGFINCPVDLMIHSKEKLITIRMHEWRLRKIQMMMRFLLSFCMCSVRPRTERMQNLAKDFSNRNSLAQQALKIFSETDKEYLGN